MAATDQTYSEDMPVAPDFLYGITKYAGELITRRYAELYGFQAVSVRLSTPYGPMERVTGHRAVMSVLYQWVGQAARGEPLSAQGHDLSGGRDYVYSVDTARGIMAILNAPELPNDLYNLTSGIWITNREILDTLSELAPDSPAPAAADAAPSTTAGGRAVAWAAVRSPAAAGPGLATGVRLAGGIGGLPAMVAGVGVYGVVPNLSYARGELGQYHSSTGPYDGFTRKECERLRCFPFVLHGQTRQRATSMSV